MASFVREPASNSFQHSTMEKKTVFMTIAFPSHRQWTIWVILPENQELDIDDDGCLSSLGNIAAGYVSYNPNQTLSARILIIKN